MALPQHVIRRYEKKVRKTHRVANVTEQNLKRQQASLMHFKRELSQTTGKLQELADKGDEHAIKRLKSVRVKLQQIDKILPYIGKYIMVNRQAEIQTVAILKESCTVNLQRLKGGATGQLNVARESREPESKRSSTHKPLETHAEEAECTSTVEPTLTTSVTPSAQTEDSVSSALPPSKTESSFPIAEPVEPAPPAPQSSPQLDEHELSPEIPHDSPYANLESVQAEMQKIHKQEEEEAKQPDRIESPYATLASVRPREAEGSKNSDEVQYAEIVKVMSPPALSPSPAPKSPYAELDFSRMQQQQQQPPPSPQPQRLTPTSPRSRLNYVEVSFNSGKSKATIANETDSKPEDMDATLVAGEKEERESFALDHTLTVTEQAEMLASRSSHSSASPKSRAAAMQEAIKLFEPSHSSTPTKPLSSKPGPPPPVKKKPKQSASSANRSSLPQESYPSPSHSTSEQTDEKHTEHISEPEALHVHDSNESQSVATGTMSVLERIKVGFVMVLCGVHANESPALLAVVSIDVVFP